MRKLFNWLIALILAIGLSGCLGYYNLSTMPQYDKVAVDAQWSEIMDELNAAESDVMQLAMILIFSGVKIPDKAIAEITAYNDQYAYWKHAAAVEIFHGDYDAAKESKRKALIALGEAAKILVSLYPLDEGPQEPTVLLGQRI